MILKSMKEYKGHPVYTLENCTACRVCQKVCPENAIEVDVEIKPDKRRILKGYKIDFEKCTFCGKCAEKCPRKTIVLVDDYEIMNKLVDKKVFEIKDFMKLKKEDALKEYMREYNTSSFANENCIGCMMCIITCPVNAISAYDDNDARVIKIDPETCGGCGMCVTNCPTNALKMGGDVFEFKVSLPVKRHDGKYFENLKIEVIDKGICSHCGTCAAICPVYGIKVEDKPIYFPNWENECIDCGACVLVCPRWDYKPLSGLGDYLEILAAKSNRFIGQDGAMVTEIVASALEMKLIDRAVFVSRDENWMPKAVTIRKVDELKDGKVTGTKYSFADVMVELRKAVFQSKKGVAVVGTPCMISGIRVLQDKVESFKKVKLAIGLFCTENFYYSQLKEFLKQKGINLDDAVKTDITKGRFIVRMEKDEVGIPVKELKSIMPSGCKVCRDFTAVEADVSVGSVGSENGFSTVVFRNEEVKKILDYIKDRGYAEFDEDINMDIIERLANAKAKRKIPD